MLEREVRKKSIKYDVRVSQDSRKVQLAQGLKCGASRKWGVISSSTFRQKMSF